MPYAVCFNLMPSSNTVLHRKSKEVGIKYGNVIIRKPFNTSQMKLPMILPQILWVGNKKQSLTRSFGKFLFKGEHHTVLKNKIPKIQ